MNISDILKTFNGCQHKRVNINSKGAYCPDCGEYVVVKWYIVRCSCCGIKRVSYLDFHDNIKPIDKYCPNCGSIHYITEEVDKINFVDINFAVHKKETVKTCRNYSSTQVWTEPNDNKETILLSLQK